MMTMKKAPKMHGTEESAAEEALETPAEEAKENDMSEGNTLPPPHPHEVKAAADTLIKAEEIKKDNHMMPHVHAHLEKHAKHVAAAVGYAPADGFNPKEGLEGLRKLAKKKQSEG